MTAIIRNYNGCFFCAESFLGTNFGDYIYKKKIDGGKILHPFFCDLILTRHGRYDTLILYLNG